MFSSYTMIETDFGIMQMYRCMRRMKIRTRYGMKTILHRLWQKATDRHTYLMKINKENIVFDKYQSFFINNIPVRGCTLKVGDMLDSRFGKSRVDALEVYNTTLKGIYLRVDNPNGRYFLANGLEVCGYG